MCSSHIAFFCPEHQSTGVPHSSQGAPYSSQFLNCRDSDQVFWHLTLPSRGVSSPGSFSATASQLFAEGGAGAFFKVCCWCVCGVFVECFGVLLVSPIWQHELVNPIWQR
jgi:hypothetical protein